MTTVRDLALICAVVGAITLVLFPIGELDPGVSSGVLYVLGVLLLASYRGLWVGVVASVISALALSWFHAPPIGQLHGKNAGDLVALGALLLTAIVGSVIADRARHRAIEAEHRLRLEGELRTRDAERNRLREVRASRARVQAAADQERRRVVRDLHDGAQQRLVHTVVTLKLAHRLLERRESRAAELVDEALDHAERANGELRELAHGILPSFLVRGGLQAGVDALASRMAMPIAIDVQPGRLAAPVEATAYFVIAEALTNVAKHARARHVWVTAAPEDGLLLVSVRDDGVGGARLEGSGLLGLQDRLAALDGRLRVESAPGGGTLVAAAIPLPD